MTNNLRTVSICGALLAGALVVVPHAPPKAAETPRPLATQVQPAVPAIDPVVTKVPAKITIDASRPSLVQIAGQHFEGGASVTLESTSYVYTLGPFDAPAATPTSIEFDAASLRAGTYQLSVRNPSGRRSNTRPVVVEAK